MPFCPGCGAEILTTAEICPICGTRIKKSHRDLPRNAHGDLVTGEKSEVLAVILGFFIIGTGLMYAGRVGLGVVHLLLSILFCWTILVPLALWIYGMIRGYELCKENNLLWIQYLEQNRQSHSLLIFSCAIALFSLILFPPSHGEDHSPTGMVYKQN